MVASTGTLVSSEMRKDISYWSKNLQEVCKAHCANDMPEIEDDNKPVEIKRAKVQEQRLYTQEGCKDGLKDLIIASIPTEMLVELEGKDNNMTNITVLEMIEQLTTNCAVS